MINEPIKKERNK